MKKLLIFTALLFAFACSDSDEPQSTPDYLSDTAWELTKEVGYEVYDGHFEEWNSKSPDYDETYIFKGDRTGTYEYCERYDGEEHRSSTAIGWAYDPAAQTLSIDYPESGDTERYQVAAITPDAMVLVFRTKEPEYGYEYYNEATYRKR